MGDGERPAFWLRDAGQSLVEFALLVPILLIVFLGAADVGRLFFYTSMISNAAREGAIYAANHSAALPDCSAGCAPLNSGPVLQHVCDASGAAAHAAPRREGRGRRVRCPSRARPTGTTGCAAR